MTQEQKDWIPSCGGNFAQATACGKCSTCLNNIQRIKDSTPLGREIDELREQCEKLARFGQVLRNEVKGTLSAHELAIRYDSGNSNWNCLEIAIAQLEGTLTDYNKWKEGE